jgi:hypothetical protein
MESISTAYAELNEKMKDVRKSSEVYLDLIKKSLSDAIDQHESSIRDALEAIEETSGTKFSTYISKTFADRVDHVVSI